MRSSQLRADISARVLGRVSVDLLCMLVVLGRVLPARCQSDATCPDMSLRAHVRKNPLRAHVLTKTSQPRAALVSLLLLREASLAINAMYTQCLL